VRVETAASNRKDRVKENTQDATQPENGREIKIRGKTAPKEQRNYTTYRKRGNLQKM
jgi:hypothetical protein